MSLAEIERENGGKPLNATSAQETERVMRRLKRKIYRSARSKWNNFPIKYKFHSSLGNGPGPH